MSKVPLLTAETTVLQVWSSHALVLLEKNPHFDPVLLHQLKRTFYSGAITMFCLIDKATGEDVDTQYHMRRLLDELNRFFEDESVHIRGG